MSKILNTELTSFIEQEIYPIYDTFDKGHNMNHILAVIERALEMAKNIEDIDINIVYAAAALHDIGIQVARKGHAMHSSNFVKNCVPLRRFFTEEEIQIIADATADHSTSAGIEPRTIYGKIVCDADKDDDLEISLLRAYEFVKKYYPLYSEEECLDNVYEQLCLKFGEDAKVKFYIGTASQRAFFNRMHELALNKDEYLRTIKEIIKKHYQKLSLDHKKSEQ